MTSLAIRNGVGLTVVVLIVCIFGVIALLRAPIQLSPDLTPTTVSVLTNWPGATPQDIEKEILTEQELFLRGLPNLEEMRSTASTGRAEVELEFRVGTNLDETLVRVQNALSQVRSYPENVSPPRIVTVASSDTPIAFLNLKPLPENVDKIDINEYVNFAEDFVVTAFERIPGVSQSEVRGGAQRALNVYVDPIALSERGISVTELRTAIRARNRDVSGGDFEEGKRRFLLRTMSRFTSVEDVENTVIATRDGVPIFLRDVGYAELGTTEVRRRVRNNGDLSLGVPIFRQPGANIIEIMDEVQVVMDELNEGILAREGLFIRRVQDDTLYVRAAISLVRDNLMIGAVLATIVLLLFLRSFPATIAGFLAIPICTICAFLGLSLAGRSINVISLAGVAFAVGMMVDSSIVVIENIYRHRGMGKKAVDAALDGTREVWPALLASTLTTIIVFLPIVFLREEVGQLFADISIAISAAIIAAFFCALTVVPTAAANLLGFERREPRTFIGRAFKNLFGLLPLAIAFKAATMATVRFLMGGIWRRVAFVSAMTAGAVGVAVLLMPQTDYLPDGNRNVLLTFATPPPGYNLEEMQRIGDELEAEFLPYLFEEDWGKFARGEASIPALQEFFYISSPQNIFIITIARNSNELDAVRDIILSRLREVPGMIPFSARRPIFGGSVGGTRGIDVQVIGTNLEDIYEAARVAFARINELGIAETIRPRPSLTLGQPLVEIRPDFVRAAELGVNSTDLGFHVWAMTDGAFLDDFFVDDTRIDMILRSTQGTVNRMEDLENITLFTSRGGTVPLLSVASAREIASTESITRIDGFRNVTLTLRPRADMALETAVGILERELIAGLRPGEEIPGGVTLRLGGATDKLAATQEALRGNIILAVVITYLLMVALFAHWGYPFVIMMSLPLGIMGGIVGLGLMNGLYNLGVASQPTPLDMLTMLGFVILIGTVVNNPILIVTQSLQNIREGKDAIAAVLESTETRVRPIMMSTLTTCAGLSPLILSPGSGAELYRGLGAVILFGLFFSTVFTLTFIPSLLSLLLQLGEKLPTLRPEDDDEGNSKPSRDEREQRESGLRPSREAEAFREAERPGTA